jgi:hypothetical protein
VSSRIDVELTSERPDGTWTWRAAGARQPKGVLDGSLLPGKAKVGDVIRAEADFDIEGITVTAVLPPRSERREPQRIEILGPPPEERRPPAKPAETRHPKARGPERPRRPRPADGEPRVPSRDGDRRRHPEQRPSRRETAARRPPAPRPPTRPKPKKLRPGRAHRDVVLAELPPEQHPIAVQVLRGGIPAVRAALEEQNAKARKEGLPEAPGEAVLAIAERLLPRLRVAEWLDRADAAMAEPDDLALRDLRSVVVSAADVARDPATRELATRLREILERRTAAERQEWLDDISGSLDAGRVVRSLRLSSRPPQPGDHLPPELTTRLAEAAGTAMTADGGTERWATVLDAVAYSSVRRSVTPAGVPPEPGDELLAAVRKHAGRVPDIAKLFGVEPPADRGGPKRRTVTGAQPPEHRARRRPGPPPDAALPPARPRRIPPPPPPPTPTPGAPVAEPAPPTTPPADPAAGAAVLPPGAPAGDQPEPVDSTDTVAEPASPAADDAAREPSATPTPAAEPDPAPARQPADAAVEPVAGHDGPDRDEPGPAASH